MLNGFQLSVYSNELPRPLVDGSGGLFYRPVKDCWSHPPESNRRPTDYEKQISLRQLHGTLFNRIKPRNAIATKVRSYGPALGEWKPDGNRRSPLRFSKGAIYPLTLSYLPLKNSFLISQLHGPVSAMFPLD